MSALYVKNLPAWERLLRVLMGSGLVGFCPMCALVGRPLDKKA